MATYTKVYNNPYPNGWKDGKDGKTPVTADILNNQTETIEAIEQYLEDNPITQGGGSGTGGTTNYEELDNLPSINGTELKGDVIIDIPEKTSDLENDSGFLTNIKEQPYSDLSGKPTINGVEVVGDLTAEDLNLSGGSGGTTDYEALDNLPSIENVELKGNVTLAELGTKKQIRISWADYQALSTEEKNDLSVVYFVYDYPENVILASNVVYDDSLSNIGAKNAQSAIETVSNIAKGRNQAHVFNTTANMQDWLSSVDNKEIFSKGDNIYIVEIDVPDWWIAEVLTEADTETGYYYKISQLETQKVDLTNYLAKSDVVDSLTSTSTDAPLSANQGRVLDKKCLAYRGILSNKDNLDNYFTLGIYRNENANFTFDNCPVSGAMFELEVIGNNYAQNISEFRGIQRITTSTNEIWTRDCGPNGWEEWFKPNIETEYYQLTGDELAEAKTMTVIKSGNVCMLRISSINSDITPNTDFILGTLPQNLRPTFNVLNVVPTNPSGGKFVYFYILSNGTVKVRSREDIASAGGLYINETYIVGGTPPV